MRGRKPDILPRVPILMQFAAEHIGSNYGAFASDYRVLVEANMRCAGNIDPAAAVLLGTPEWIERQIRACYEAAGSPYMVNVGCEIPSGAPFENLRALCRPQVP